MPVISQQKKEKISEQILHHLFTLAPSAEFTSKVAEAVARDEEFTKALLLDLQQKKLVVEIKKNNKGVDYTQRQRWRMSNQAYEIYKKHQPGGSGQQTFSTESKEDLTSSFKN